MRSMLKTGLVVLTLAVLPLTAAQAGRLEGAAIGAGSGAIIAGPPGAVVGGVIGAVVGGPNIVKQRRQRVCWTNSRGNRECGQRR